MRDNYLMGSYKYDGPFFKIPLSMKAVLFIDSKQGNINDNWSQAMDIVYKDTGIRVHLTYTLPKTPQKCMILHT